MHDSCGGHLHTTGPNEAGGVQQIARHTVGLPMLAALLHVHVQHAVHAVLAAMLLSSCCWCLVRAT
jgi:hypothetical protein